MGEQLARDLANRLVEIQHRRETLQALLAEEAVLVEEAARIEARLTLYHLPPSANGAAPVPEVYGGAVPLADPITETLLAILHDETAPLPTIALVDLVTARVGSEVSYSVLDGRLRRGTARGDYAGSSQGWWRGPKLRRDA